MKENKFSLIDGNQVDTFAIEWRPETNPKAVIVLIHGLGEHCKRYKNVAKFFTQKGIGIISADLYGHGKTGGKRGYIPIEDAFLNTIDALLIKAKELYSNLPIFLYGHSMGGWAVMWYSLDRKPGINGVIATSPFLAEHKPSSPLKIFLARVMNTLNPSFIMKNGLDLDALSRDKEVVTKYKNDPLVHGFISARLGWTMLNKGKWIIAHAAEFPLPLLLMVGSGERIVSQQLIEEFVKKAPHVDYKIWPALYHELHNEPEKESVLIYELDWITKHLQMK